MTVKQKIQSLLTAANDTTGESDTNLTDAVSALIDGYGQGGISLEDVYAYVLDFESDPITMTAGGVNSYGGFFTT